MKLHASLSTGILNIDNCFHFTAIPLANATITAHSLAVRYIISNSSAGCPQATCTWKVLHYIHPVNVPLLQCGWSYDHDTWSTSIKWYVHKPQKHATHVDCVYSSVITDGVMKVASPNSWKHWPVLSFGTATSWGGNIYIPHLIRGKRDDYVHLKGYEVRYIMTP